MRRRQDVIRFIVLFFGGLVLALACQAGTVKDPDIPVDELELRLRPMLREQLETEARDWQMLLQEQVKAVSTAEIAARYKKQALSGVDKAKEALSAYEKAEQLTKEKPDDETAQDKLREAHENLDQELAAANEEISKAMQDREVAAVANAAEKVAKESGKVTGTQPVAPVKASSDIATLKQRFAELEETESSIRSEVLAHINQLREAQTAATDRFNVVIRALESKGGDAEKVEEYRQYVKAVSGIQVDVSDTEAIWVSITGWLKSEEGGLRWARNFLLFVVTMAVFVLLSKMAARALQEIFARSKHTSQLLSGFMVATVRRLTLAIGVLVGLAAMDVDVGPVLAVIGAAGFVIAFALQNSLGNFASGILILVFRPFDVGDVIEVAGVLGKVESMNLLSIQVYTPDNKSVIIANNQIWGNVITNVTGTDTRRVDLLFGIAYSDDATHARRILEELVGNHAKVLQDPAPVIRLHELGESSVNFICRPWVHTADYWEVYWDLTEQVKQRFDQEGISIPFPQRDVHLIQPSTQAQV
jgi:small conductance mechanosensitive channel